MGSSQTRARTRVPALAGRFSTTVPPGKPPSVFSLLLSESHGAGQIGFGGGKRSGSQGGGGGSYGRGAKVELEASVDEEVDPGVEVEAAVVEEVALEEDVEGHASPRPIPQYWWLRYTR